MRERLKKIRSNLTGTSANFSGALSKALAFINHIKKSQGSSAGCESPGIEKETKTEDMERFKLRKIGKKIHY